MHEFNSGCEFDVAVAGISGEPGHREGPAHGPDGPRQAEFAGDEEDPDVVDLQLAGGEEQAEKETPLIVVRGSERVALPVRPSLRR